MFKNVGNGNLIQLYYPAFAGGKFIGNCIALSSKAVFQDPALAYKDINIFEFDKQYYQWKYKSALNTLPDKENLHNWGSYEYGCHTFFKNQDIINAISKTDRYYFKITHYKQELDYIKRINPNTISIGLKKFEKFTSVALPLKSPNKNLNDHLSWLIDWDYAECDYYFDINSIFNPTEFEKNIKDLYSFLNINDYQKTLVMDFYYQYKNLHNI